MFNPSVDKIIGSIEAKGVRFTYSDDLDSAALKAVVFRPRNGDNKWGFNGKLKQPSDMALKNG